VPRTGRLNLLGEGTKRIPLLGICAYGSGCGKTTLLTQLIPALHDRGIRVSIIKHAHHSFDIDHPGKDSYRLRQSGAIQTMLGSSKRWALMTEFAAEQEPRLEELAAQLDPHLADLVLVEGFKQAPIPKIEVHRPSLELPLLAPHDSTIVAVATDAPIAIALPTLDLNNIDEVAAFIMQWFKTQVISEDEYSIDTMNHKPISDLIRDASCMDDYDPNSMPVDQARRHIRNYLSPVSETQRVPLRESLGRVLASAIISPCNVPNHDNSAMDGYAFSADDLQSDETRLEIIGTAYAGKAFEGSVKRGECVRIMTGAVIPAGADTVIMQEKVQVSGNHIVFTEVPKRHMNKRYAGEDLKLGQEVLPAGRLMRAADLGLVASLGIGEVEVYRKLRVAFFSTGDELTSIGTPLAPGQVYDSNRYTLYGMLTRMDVEILDMGVVRDDLAALEQTLIDASAKADVIITSGGVSVGEADYMKQLLEKLGQVLFWKIAMKPGRPLAYGKIGQAHYFGLPGNPVAVMVTFYQFVREALLVLMGQPEPAPLPMLEVITSEDIRKLPGRTEFQRGILFADSDGNWKVRPTGNQGSGILRSMSEANCFIVLNEEVGDLPAGSTVKVQLLTGLT